MSDIQRWTVSQMNDHGWQLSGHDDGEWVAYADHVAAVAAAEQRVTERHNAEHEDDRLAAFQNGYDAATVKERQRSVLLIADAYGKGLSAARDAVAAVVQGNQMFYTTAISDALAAIDGLTNGKKEA